MRTATIQIRDPQHEGGFLTINEADFDPAVHTRFDEAPAPTLDVDEPVAESAAEPSAEPAPEPAPADEPRSRRRK